VESVRRNDYLGVDLQSVGQCAPASLRVSVAIATAATIMLAYDVFTSTGLQARDVLVAAVLPLLLWLGALFDWRSARTVSVKRAISAQRMLLESRPSHMPPQPTRLDRAA
jgi:hypothetical protein